ncbi:MAG TPA: peptide deformylase [Acidiferrobacterales bacterium]
MAVLPVLVYPDPRLRRVSAPVTTFDAGLRRLVADLEDTRLASPGAVGIAAPQVGELKRIVIVDVSGRAGIAHHGHLVLVNPEILAREGEARGREGCLSVPDYVGKVARAARIRLRARDVHGGSREFDAEGYEARALQHELDHLDGLLFLDRIISPRRDLHRREPEPGPVGKNSK